VPVTCTLASEAAAERAMVALIRAAQVLGTRPPRAMAFIS